MTTTTSYFSYMALSSMSIMSSRRLIIAAAIGLSVLPSAPMMCRNADSRNGAGAVIAFSVGEFGSAAWAMDNLFEVDAEKLASTIENYFKQVETAIEVGDIRLAKQQLSLIDFKVRRYDSLIPKNNKKNYNKRLDSLKEFMKHVVDSLIQVNVAIVAKKGRTAAIEFRRQIAAQGLSEAQLAPVDEAILNASSADERPFEQAQTPTKPAPVQPEQPKIAPPAPKTTTVWPRPSETVPEPEKTIPETYVSDSRAPEPSMEPAPAVPEKSTPQQAAPPVEVPVVSKPVQFPHETIQPPQEAFRFSAEVSMDSGLDQGRKLAGSMAMKVTGLLSENRIDEAVTVFQIYRMNLERFLSPSAYENLRIYVETAYAQDQAQRSRALQVSREIDDLVDEDRCLEAHKRLSKQRDFLKKYIDEKQFEKLEEKVGQATVAFGKARGAAQAKAREIKMLFSDGNVEEACSAFERSGDELKQFLDKEVFEGLQRTADAAVEALRDQKKQGRLCRDAIQDLMDDGKGALAFARFTENKVLLQSYLNSQDYSALSNAVVRANSDFFSRQAKAQAEAYRIDSLIVAKRIEQARDRFSDYKKTLRKDLADDRRFFGLKERVFTAYDDFHKKKQQAAHSIKRIKSLINDEEGREAYFTFIQDSVLLHEFLEKDDWGKLRESIRTAVADYELRLAAARKKASELAALLANNRFEPAYVAYKNARDTLERFLDIEAGIAAVCKRVVEAYSTFKKHRRWAFGIMEEIKDHIEQKQGEQAFSILEKTKPQLSLYIDKSELSSLEASAAEAKKQYRADKALAKKNTKRLYGLLDKKRFEEAYTLFKDLRDGLEPYLSETTFINLRNEVTNAYDEYVEKKARAEDYAEELRDLVEDKKKKEARSNFLSNRKSLKQYLDPAAFADLEKLIIGSPKKPAKKGKSRG